MEGERKEKEGKAGEKEGRSVEGICWTNVKLLPVRL